MSFFSLKSKGKNHKLLNYLDIKRNVSEALQNRLKANF